MAWHMALGFCLSIKWSLYIKTIATTGIRKLGFRRRDRGRVVLCPFLRHFQEWKVQGQWTRITNSNTIQDHFLRKGTKVKGKWGFLFCLLSTVEYFSEPSYGSAWQRILEIMPRPEADVQRSKMQSKQPTKNLSSFESWNDRYLCSFLHKTGSLASMEEHINKLGI